MTYGVSLWLMGFSLWQPTRKLQVPVKQVTDYFDNAFENNIHYLHTGWKHRKYTVSHSWNPLFCKYTRMTTKMWPYLTSVLHCTVRSCTISLIPTHEWQQIILANKIMHLFTYYWSWFGYWLYDEDIWMAWEKVTVKACGQKYCRHSFPPTYHSDPAYFLHYWITLMSRRAWGR